MKMDEVVNEDEDEDEDECEDDDDDEDEDRQQADKDVEDTEPSTTALPALQALNDSAVAIPANESSDAVNATRNVTRSFPPPPDQKYVDTLFKIAHIFHFIGIGILAFFVLQVTAYTCKEVKKIV